MATPLRTETTHFTRDVLGRYVCNTWDEAMASSDASARPEARPFDFIVIGGGSFGAVVAHALFTKLPTKRILVLEAGLFVLPEHVQNFPVLGLNPPGPTRIADLRAISQDGKPRAELWGLPWHSPVPFPGLAYCVGGRSVYFGGWSPRLLPQETATWPPDVVADLTSRYFDQAAEQIGTDTTNDFIDGPLHRALRKQLFDGVNAGQIQGAIPLAELPLHLKGVPPAQLELSKVEAPLAVQTRTRSGAFPFNKFSSLPLIMKAARLAYQQSGDDDVKKRLMVVADAHVTRLVVEQGRVTQVLTQRGAVQVPGGGAVIVAAATIESARLAQLSFGGIPNESLLGTNLMAHLRSNLTIRVPRSSISSLSAAVKELQASALFLKGRHAFADGSVGHFHLQITAAGLGDLKTTDSEAELFKKIPDVDTFERFRSTTDTQVVLTLRGIGEMEPANPASFVRLDPELDEYGVQRSFVSIAPSSRDLELWDAMDRASDDAALVFAGGQGYEVLRVKPDHSTELVPVAGGVAASTVLPFTPPRRDGLGTTHHEAGTLRLGEDPTSSVTSGHGRFHHLANAYALGPAVFPTIGSPNPMLTGVALARRMADHFASPQLYVPEAGFTALFDGVSTANWKMAGAGSFFGVDGILEAVPGSEIGLFWCTTPTPADFVLRLEWMRTREDDNSGVFVRFPDPDSKGYFNTAFVGVDFGFEVQLDEHGDTPIHRTGAFYDQAGQTLTQKPALPPGQWNELEIRVQGQSYAAFLNGDQVSAFDFPPGSDPAHPDRGLPSTAAQPRFVGLQAHTGRILFRRIRLGP